MNMNVPDRIKKLIDTFDNNLESYKKGTYNETQLRREFLDPFFEELGWDITNKQGYAEAYKDVIHEDAIKIGGVTKAPDYCFRIGGTRKFFLEAKKPSLNIKDDVHPAYQLRRYAWSAKLPLSILTDFEEFAVYDCRVRPTKTDKASHSRILYMTYTDYPEQWDEIAGIFSRESILKGSFDKYVESKRAKRGTTEVDAAFLQEIERWRNLLARNIALRNPAISQRELNFAVQRTIDRIIFLRICEDRGIELYGKLIALQNGTQVYKRLFQFFRQADDRYNSGLFHFRSEKDRDSNVDNLTPGLVIDDKVLKDILKHLYYPDSPYEFSVLPADILGQVYEQFLGKVIRLTPAHHAVVEDKPEVRKAGGVYYTPTYIVDYIVKQTVGKLVEGKKPGPRGAVGKLKILDPACGSGSFLLGAYQYLLDWHRDEYVKDHPKKWATGKNPRLYQSSGGDWRLTTDERKRILLNNIYGVDIDSQAVETTKLSLLLKVLEGEDEQTITQQLALFHQRALPDLANNIKCGNSLIGPDFYDGEQMSLFNEEKMYRVNAFDWNVEFPEIIKKGGFDAVIGNPPWVRQELISEHKDYFETHYRTYHGVADLYQYFIEKGISILNEKGYFSYIVASKWLRVKYGLPLRKWLKEQTIHKLIDFGDLPVFRSATTYSSIIIASKPAKPNEKVFVVEIGTLEFENLAQYVNEHEQIISKDLLDDNGWLLKDEAEINLIRKLNENHTPLDEYVSKKIYYGIKTGYNKAFVIGNDTRKALIEADTKNKEIIKPFLVGKDIKRYRPPKSDTYVIFTRRGIDINKYPEIKSYLFAFKENLTPKPAKWKGGKWPGRKPGKYEWYEIQDTVDYYKEFEKTKILWPGISKEVAAFTLDNNKYYGNDNNQLIITDDKFLLGVLNSKVTKFFLTNTCDKVQGGFYRLKIIYVKQIPIPKTRSPEVERLVASMLKLNEQLQSTKLETQRQQIQRAVDHADKKIDNLVYELYGLSKEEVEIIEQT